MYMCSCPCKDYLGKICADLVLYLVVYLSFCCKEVDTGKDVLGIEATVILIMMPGSITKSEYVEILVVGSQCFFCSVLFAANKQLQDFCLWH